MYHMYIHCTRSVIGSWVSVASRSLKAETRSLATALALSWGKESGFSWCNDHVYIYIYMYAFIYMYVYIYVYIHIHI